ncbi:uncharacterized protein LOC130940056 [Arachis stenosperma]|uniref:uncharacterized protein LOC130940056 n=1 Tax=Arachis stenosperma TaxID=217475 RepID=UPI0025AB9C38|nr:uncharacterized protein LOC130940056 [Arachis stenosperma]
MNGPQVPTKTGTNGVVIHKIEADWNDENKKKIELNAKAINVLNYAIRFKKYRKVSKCKIAKEIWNKLQVTHEGTIQVKQTRIDMMCKEYEMFFMKEGEFIDYMFERFSIIINGLDAMRITKVQKILIKEWKTKVIVISESGNISQMAYDELRGKLLVYEITHLKNDTKKKGVAPKSCIESLGDESSDDLSYDEFVFFVRKLRRMMKLRGRSKESSSREPKKDLRKVICHNCKEAGHYKYDYPKLKKEDKSEKDKKNGLMASWKDMENDSDEDENSDNSSQAYLMADHNQSDEFYLASKKKDDMWYMDSRCSRHMTGKFTFFIKLEKYNGGFVTFGDNDKGQILAIEEDARTEDDLNSQKDQEKDKSVPTVKNASSDSADQNTRDNSVLSPTKVGDSGTVNTVELNQNQTKITSQKPKEWKFLRNYPHKFIIRDLSHGVTTRSSNRKRVEINKFALLSQMELQNIKEALEVLSWVNTMKKVLVQFEKNEVWTLVPCPNGKKVTGTKWIFRNKLGEDGSVVQNKAR